MLRLWIYILLLACVNCQNESRSFLQKPALNTNGSPQVNVFYLDKGIFTGQARFSVSPPQSPSARSDT